MARAVWKGPFVEESLIKKVDKQKSETNEPADLYDVSKVNYHNIGKEIKKLEKLIKLKDLENRVFLMGFSQGGMMSLHVGLRRENYIGGIISFSGALIFPDHLKEIKNGSPVLMVHGEDDEVVPFKEMNKGCNHLKDHNIEVETLGIPKLGHGINDLGIKQAIKFMKEKFEIGLNHFENKKYHYFV